MSLSSETITDILDGEVMEMWWKGDYDGPLSKRAVLYPRSLELGLHCSAELVDDSNNEILAWAKDWMIRHRGLG
jgi:hypothetical protein